MKGYIPILPLPNEIDNNTNQPQEERKISDGFREKSESERKGLFKLFNVFLAWSTRRYGAIAGFFVRRLVVALALFAVVLVLTNIIGVKLFHLFPEGRPGWMPGSGSAV